MRRLLLAPASLLALHACGDKCPDGYEANDETEECVAISGGGADGADGAGDGADGAGDGADGAGDGADGAGDGADGGGDGSDGGDGSTSLPDDALNGTVSIPGIVDGEIEAWTAFSHEASSEVTGGNLLLIYMSSSPDATCAGVVGYLNNDGNDPSALFPDNVCNLTLQLFRPSFGTWSDGNALSLSSGGSVSGFVECSFGYGGWVNTTVGSTTGWFWQDDGSVDTGSDPEDTPRWFQGQVNEGEITGLETAGGGHEVLIEPDEFIGVFPYDEELGNSGARGTGKGLIRAVACPELQSTRYFTAPPED
jgi:hypothetical protein